MLFVKYKESVGERRTNTIAAAEVKIRERTSIDLEIALDSPSSCAMSATNLVAALDSPKEATDDPIPATRPTAE